MRYPSTIVLATLVLLGFAPLASADDVCANPDAIGVSRVQEIDTSGGIQAGDLQYGHSLKFLADKEVVLTFDDGPFENTTPEILATLAEHCTKATFFYVGKMALRYPDLLQQVDKAGHTIGAHTWGHANLRKLPPVRASVEIEKGIGMLEARLGHPIAPFFRFPYLSDPKVDIKYMLGRDFGVFSIDVDSWDSHGLVSSERIVKYVMTRLNAKGHGIVLLHDIKHTTAHALPELLRQLKENGYKIVHMVPKAPAATLPVYVAWAKKMIERQEQADALLVASNSKKKARIQEIPFEIAEAGTPATPDIDAPKGKKKPTKTDALVVATLEPARQALADAGKLPADPSLPEHRGRRVPTFSTPAIAVASAEVRSQTAAPLVVAALAPSRSASVLSAASVAQKPVATPGVPLVSVVPVEKVAPKPAAPAPIVVAALAPPPAPIAPVKQAEMVVPKAAAPAPVVVATMTPPPAPIAPVKPVEKIVPKPAALAPVVVAAVAPPPAQIAPVKPVEKIVPKLAALAPVVVASVAPPSVPVAPVKTVEKVVPKLAALAPVVVAAVAPPSVPVAPVKTVEKAVPKPAAPVPVVVAAVAPPSAPVAPVKPVEKAVPKPAAPAPVVNAAVAPPSAPMAPVKPVEKAVPKPAAPAPVVNAAIAPPSASMAPVKPVEKVTPKPAAPAPVVNAAVAPVKPVDKILPKPATPAPVIIAAVTPPPAPVASVKPVEKIVPKPATPAPVVIAAVTPPSAAVAPVKSVEKVVPKPAAPVTVAAVAQVVPVKPATPAPTVVAPVAPTPAAPIKPVAKASAKPAVVAAVAPTPKPAPPAKTVVTRLTNAGAGTENPARVFRLRTIPKTVGDVAELTPPPSSPNPLKAAPPPRALRPLKPSAGSPPKAYAAPVAARPPKHVQVAALDVAPKKQKPLRPLKTVPGWVAINDTPQPGTSRNSSRN